MVLPDRKDQPDPPVPDRKGLSDQRAQRAQPVPSDRKGLLDQREPQVRPAPRVQPVLQARPVPQVRLVPRVHPAPQARKEIWAPQVFRGRMAATVQLGQPVPPALSDPQGRLGR
jgi:hypothetical protein